MKQVAMDQVNMDQVNIDPSGYLQVAATENVVITRGGQPVGILIGLEDELDGWEELLLRDPQFEGAIVQARQSLQQGQGTSLEAMRARYAA
jgi:antitoxin (DNA-binding transcriptional repressor) of toxin-antitoxin stability system